jgi:hypothetical protein
VELVCHTSEIRASAMILLLIVGGGGDLRSKGDVRQNFIKIGQLFKT